MLYVGVHCLPMPECYIASYVLRRCGDGYCIKYCKQNIEVAPGVTLQQLNTQVCEQCNSRLENVRTQVR